MDIYPSDFKQLSALRDAHRPALLLCMDELRHWICPGLVGSKGGTAQCDTPHYLDYRGWEGQ